MRRRDGYLAIERRKLEHEQELEAMYGDGVLAIVRNPKLSIAQEIEALGRSVAPRDSTVQVAIDRFTDFDVSIQLPAEESPSEMAVICGRILEHDAKYLHRIRLYAQNRLVGELDPTAIGELIASTPMDEALLTEALAKSVKESPTSTDLKPPTAANEGMSAENDALNKIIEEWNASLESHCRGINDVINGLCDTVDFSTLKTKSDLSERLRKVESFTERISSEQTYFAHAIDSFRQKIGGNDPLVVTIMMRQMQQGDKGLLRQTKPLLIEVANLQSNIRRLLESLEVHPDGWKLVGDGRIEFTTTSTHINFKVRNGEVAESVKRLTERLGAMRATPSATP